MEKITFVGVVANNDIDVFINLTLYSILRNFNNNDIEEFLIITPPHNMKYFQQQLYKKYNKNNKIKLINEKTVFTKEIEKKYHLHMLLKLYASFIVKTKLYITLDSDMYLTKKISIKDIIINNKPILNFEKICWHSEWHNTNKNVLGVINDIKLNITDSNMNIIGLNNLDENDECTGVTPCILYTDITQQLLNKYAMKMENLPSSFTEYSLYSLYITHILQIKLDKLYYRKSLYNNCIWIRKSEQEYNFKNDFKDFKVEIDNQFSQEDTIFSLSQSSLVSSGYMKKYDYNIIVNYIISLVNKV